MSHMSGRFADVKLSCQMSKNETPRLEEVHKKIKLFTDIVSILTSQIGPVKTLKHYRKYFWAIL